MQGAEGETEGAYCDVCDRRPNPKATPQIAYYDKPPSGAERKVEYGI